MSVLVTGSDGFIGSHLMRGMTGAEGYDIKQERHVTAAVHGLGATTVYHLGSRVGMGESHYRPVDYMVDNVVGTAGLLETLEREGTVEHIVLASSVTAMLGGSPYAESKRMQERLCRMWCDRNGVSLSVLRLYNVYGPGQSLTNPYSGVVANFAQRLLAGLPPTVYEDGLQTRDFVNVADVLDAMVKAADARFDGVAEIGTGTPTAIIDLVSILRSHLGGPLPTITGEHRQGDVRDMRADIQRAYDGFGWSPTVSLSQGLSDYAESLDGVSVGVVPDAAQELREAGALR